QRQEHHRRAPCRADDPGRRGSRLERPEQSARQTLWAEYLWAPVGYRRRRHSRLAGRRLELSLCGSYVAMIPHERELAQYYAGRPFVIVIGVLQKQFLQ